MHSVYTVNTLHSIVYTLNT